MIFRFDAWILKHIEKFTHRFQLLTGKNCFWLARAVIIASMFAAAIHVNVMAGDISFSLRTVVVIIFCSWSLLLCWMIGLVERWAEQDYRCSGAANSQKNNVFGRLFLMALTLSVMPILESYEYIGAILMVYLVACDPLPPGTSKVRKAIEWFKAQWQSITTPAPEPKPIPIRF